MIQSVHDALANAYDLNILSSIKHTRIGPYMYTTIGNHHKTWIFVQIGFLEKRELQWNSALRSATMELRLTFTSL